MIQTSPMSWVFMFFLNFFTISFIIFSKDKKFLKNKKSFKITKNFSW